jgi:peptidoglycan/xylan/chitin deacetylase (PgdA/CDA1 family)
LPVNPLVPIGSSLVAACASLITYGAVYPRSQLFGKTLCRTDSPGKLAITFDDGPNPAITPKLLDLLQRYNARATFFVVGKYVRACPDLVHETAAGGHLIANHTQTHPNLFSLSSASIRAELQQCQEAIGAVLNSATHWFRPPFGFRNPWVVKTAAELGMQTVMWTLIPGDWTPQPPENLIRHLQPIARHAEQNLSSPRATGDVLCLHDGGYLALNADRTHTLKALEHWLPRWRDAGLEFVTIEQAVNTPAP